MKFNNYAFLPNVDEKSNQAHKKELFKILKETIEKIENFHSVINISGKGIKYQGRPLEHIVIQKLYYSPSGDTVRTFFEFHTDDNFVFLHNHPHKDSLNDLEFDDLDDRKFFEKVFKLL
jgi:hypothetical protein